MIKSDASTQISIVAFDYGRTLYDREADKFFDDAREVLVELSTRYKLAIVSFSKPEEVDDRIEKLKALGVFNLFETVAFADSPEKKDEEYERLILSMNLAAKQMAICG